MPTLESEAVSRAQHIMIDLGTGNNNKINWAIPDKQKVIGIIESRRCIVGSRPGWTPSRSSTRPHVSLLCGRYVLRAAAERQGGAPENATMER